MSGDYASRLKEYHHKGVVGLPETSESKRSLKLKVEQLASYMRDASKIVFLTGAGISTSAGIPDFRGPRGVWTLEAKQKRKECVKFSRKRGREEESDTPKSGDDDKGTNTTTNATATTAPMDFDKAKPTLTHRALYYLFKTDTKRSYFCITQNVDGLHRRSGLTRRHLAILHGCVFTEKCQDCGREYFRDEQVPGISFQPTGTKCTKCGGPLRDILLDWCDHLPEDDWDRCQERCNEADLIITLGTSLRMEPAASLVTHGKRYVIVNLQVTPYDEGAAMVVRARVDALWPLLLQALGHPFGWETVHPNPPIERESDAICPRYGTRWWKPPRDHDSEDDSSTG